MKRLIAVVTLVLALGAQPIAAAGATDRSDRVRAFAVGARVETFVDSSRPTPPSGATPGSSDRSLTTLILFPARGKPGVDVAALADADQPQQFLDVIGKRRPLSGHGQFPVAVYAHGLGGGMNYLTYSPAAAGYIVVAPSFPLSRKDVPGGPSGADALEQPGDVSFVISKVLHLPRHDRDLRSIIDPTAIGVTGASLGAATAVAVATNSCCRDNRIDAVASIAGGEAPIPGGTYFSGRPVPLLVVHGTSDPAAPYAGSAQLYADAPVPKIFVSLTGAGHIRFGPPWDDVVARAQADFFDRYLKHQRTALRRLRHGVEASGVATVQLDTSARVKHKPAGQP